MDVSSLKQKLHAYYALSEVEEMDRTDSVLIFRATNTWATSTAVCEMFTKPADETLRKRWWLTVLP